MIGRITPSRLPVSIKVPLLLATFMVIVAAGISKAVLNRLDQSQQHHFREIKEVFLQGLATAMKPYMIRRDPWEVFDVLDRARQGYAAPKAHLTLVLGADRKVLAASDPKSLPIGSEPPEDLTQDTRVPDLNDPSGEIWIARDIFDGGVHLGTIAALVDIRDLQTDRREALFALIGFNALLTLLLAAVGWILVRRAIQPLVKLSDLMGRSVNGRLAAVPEHELPPVDTEAGKAFRSYNAAAAAIDERETLLKRLATEEQASLIGRYASAMAHEVNNPLGGLFNAVRMIQRHGDDVTQREKAAQLLERGLTSIRNVVKASLLLWRRPAPEAKVTPADIEDLRYLVASEADRRDLDLLWENKVQTELPVPVQPVRQIALNLLLNACAASSPGSQVGFRAYSDEEGLTLDIFDQGSGLPVEAQQLLLNGAPFGVPVSSGLGLWTVARLVAELEGKITLSSENGSFISIRLPYHAQRILQSAA